MPPPERPALPSRVPCKSGGSTCACGRRVGKTMVAESRQKKEKESADLKIETLTDVALFNSAMGLLALVRSQHVC